MIPGFTSLQAALLSIGIIVGVLIIQEYRINSWKSTAFEAEKKIEIVRGQNIAFNEALKMQNARIEALINTANEIQAKAELAALKIKRRTEMENIKIRKAGSGPEEMNRWFSGLFQ